MFGTFDNQHHITRYITLRYILRVTSQYHSAPEYIITSFMNIHINYRIHLVKLPSVFQFPELGYQQLSPATVSVCKKMK